MNTFLLLKIAHGLATLLLFVMVLALGWWSWRLHRGPLEGAAARLSRWPARCAWVLGLCVLSLPISGWWLTHLAGWPLSQTWLLGGSLAFLLGAACWLWLAARGASRPEALRSGLDRGLAGLGLLAFVVVLMLMVIKPA